MQINTNETQILTITSSTVDCESYLSDEKGTMIPADHSLKMLGFNFTRKPMCPKQIEELIRKANKRAYLLLNYKKNGVKQDKLKLI